MILYFAASFIDESVDTVGRLGHKNVLFSYHYFKDKLKQVREWRQKYGFTMIIDSGAFSAYTAGITIDINEYMEFLRRLRPKYYAVLDDLVDPERTIFNQKLMERKGFKPMPTFHIGEPLKYLDLYLKYDYIALGGMVGAANLENWLPSVWQYIYRRNPKIKVHGFGLTTQEHMQPYPFYSVDSSTYLNPPRYGIVNLWSPEKNEMYWKKYHEVEPSYAKGSKMDAFHRDKSITIAATEFIKMTAFINKYQKQNGFNHLLTQQTLW